MSGGRPLSERAYRRLLVAYPRKFREEYGAHMVQVFGDLCWEERRRAGALGLARLWVGVVPDLVVSTISERSDAMGRTLGRAGRHFNLENLMLLNAAVLLVCGLAAAFAPSVTSEAYGLSAAVSDENPRSTVGNAHLAIARFFAILCIGFGSLLWAASHALDVSGRAASFAGALFATNLFGSLLLLAQQHAIWVSVVGWITVAVHLFFAAGYGHCMTRAWKTWSSESAAPSAR